MKEVILSLFRFNLIAHIFCEQVLLSNSDLYLEEGMKINIRLHNYPESMIVLKNLKAAYIGTLRIQLSSYIFSFLHISLQKLFI